MRLIDTREVVRYLVPKYAAGKTLDVGGGTSKYRAIIKATVPEYFVSDLYETEGVDFVEDARKLAQKNESYDTVVSFQVLEHVDDTKAVVSEMFRVLKSGGHAIVTAPFIAAQHAYPSDYHRFTQEGLKAFFVAAGFEIMESGTQGSTLSVFAELIRLPRFFSKEKKPSRFGRFFWHRVLRLLKYLDRKGFCVNPNLYTNVYIVAKKTA